MKLITTLTALALLASATAMAAASTSTSSAAAPAAATTHVDAKEHSKAHCNHEASEKKLSGKERTEFMKSCRTAG